MRYTNLLSMLTSLPSPPFASASMHPLSPALLSRKRQDKRWINVSKLHNALSQNHLLDIFDAYGTECGLQRDTASPKFSPSASYAHRMMRLGEEFRDMVRAEIINRNRHGSVCTIPVRDDDDGEEGRALTKDAIYDGKRVIFNAVVCNSQARIYARVPLLIDYEIASELFPHALPDGLHAREFVVVGMKRQKLQLDNLGRVKRGCMRKLQTEMWVWKTLSKETVERGSDLGLIIGMNSGKTRAMAGRMEMREVWCGGAVDFDREDDVRNMACEVLAREALEWRATVVDMGGEWMKRAREKCKDGGSVMHQVCLHANDMKFRPNMKVAKMYNFPWADEKKRLADSLCELTLVSGIGLADAQRAMTNGIANNYCGRLATAEELGVKKGGFTEETLRKMKVGYDGEEITPRKIGHNRWNWRREGMKQDECLFYVDFELASPGLVRVGGGDEALIFMIGCGRMWKGRWEHCVMVADELSMMGEANLVVRFLQHLKERRGGGERAVVYVWGPERRLLRDAVKRTRRAGYGEGTKEWEGELEIIDMLDVVIKGHVSVKGCLNNRIGSVADALLQLGRLCESQHAGAPHGNDYVKDGFDAMAVALKAADMMISGHILRLIDGPLMAHVTQYNEKDCYDIASIAEYLRRYH